MKINTTTGIKIESFKTKYSEHRKQKLSAMERTV